MQADKYAKWYCADAFLRECPRSLQVMDLKGKNELRNCAPLKGEEKAAQNGFSLPSLGDAVPSETTPSKTQPAHFWSPER